MGTPSSPVLKDFPSDFPPLHIVDIEGLCGKENTGEANRVLSDPKKSVLSFQSFRRERDSIVCSMKFGADVFILSLNPYRQALECSCGSEIRVRGSQRQRKGCKHIAILLLILVTRPSSINLHFTETKPEFSNSESDEAAAARLEARRHKFDEFGVSPADVRQALEAIDNLMVCLLTRGLQRVSSATLQWITATALKAHFAKLIRLERELNGLAAVLRQYLLRDPLFSFGAFLNQCATIRTYGQLTSRAIEGESNLPTDLPTIFGEARSMYVTIDTGKIEAQFIGVNGWISQSGFLGCTAYLYDVNRQRMFTLANVRPIHLGIRDPVKLYRFPTYTGFSLADLSQHFLTMNHAKVNEKGAISLCKELIVSLKPPRSLMEEVFGNIRFSDWLSIVEHLRKKEISPIPTASYVTDDLFILEPSAWGEFELDEVDQVWSAPLIDKGGHEADMHVQNTPENRTKVHNLGMIYKAGIECIPQALFGKVFARKSKLVVDPISAIWYQGIKIRERRQRMPQPELASSVHLSVDEISGLER